MKKPDFAAMLENIYEHGAAPDWYLQKRPDGDYNLMSAGILRRVSPKVASWASTQVLGFDVTKEAKKKPKPKPKPGY